MELHTTQHSINLSVSSGVLANTVFVNPISRVNMRDTLAFKTWLSKIKRLKTTLLYIHSFTEETKRCRRRLMVI